MRVLIVAYYFPPLGGGGVRRTLQLVRQLAAAGDEVWVLSVDDAAWVHDPALLADVPERVRVLRLPNPDWGRVVARRGVLPRASARRAAPGRLRRWLVPDLHVGWSALATPVAAGLARGAGIDVVYTTAPPYSAHAPGLAARSLGVPWVADFRDAWTDCPTRRDFGPARRRVETALERAVLRRADRVLFASDAARERALAREPDLAERSETVLTGFDPREFPVCPPPRGGPLEIVHAGSVLVNQMGPVFDDLLRALRDGCARRPELARELRLRFVGGEPELATRIEAHGLGDWVGVEPALPRRELGTRLLRAHACLALSAPGAFGADPIPGKTFDAVGASRPLLALCAPGAFARLVERLALGAVVAPGDPAALLARLEAWLATHAGGGRIPGPPPESRAELAAPRAMERIRAQLCRAVEARAEAA